MRRVLPLAALLACAAPQSPVPKEPAPAANLRALAIEMEATTIEASPHRSGLSPAQKRGMQLYSDKACPLCHDEGDVGPSLRGIWGQTRTRRVESLNIEDDDEEVIVDAHYLKASLTRPSYIVRDGFNPVMPSYGPNKLTDDQISDLVAYLITVAKDGAGYSINRPGSDLDTSR